jgi:hypothetical protein
MTDQALIDRYGPDLEPWEYALLEHFREVRELKERLERLERKEERLPAWIYNKRP